MYGGRSAMAKAEFNVGNKRLIITIRANDVQWSTLHVEEPEGIITLGSETLSIIKEKCINSLSSLDRQESLIYKNVNVVPIINLAEPHASVSASPLGDGGIELYLLDSNNKFYPFMKLTEPDLDRLIVFFESLIA
jgi:hypothetical protein